MNLTTTTKFLFVSAIAAANLPAQTLQFDFEVASKDYLSFSSEAVSINGGTPTVVRTDRGPLSTVSGSFNLDLSTPDYDPLDADVGRYIGGISRTPIFTEPGEPENFVTDMSIMLFSDNEADLFSEELLPLSSVRSDQFTYFSPTAAVYNDLGIITTFANGFEASAGSDVLELTFQEVSSVGARGGTRTNFSLLLVDSSGSTFADDSLPTTLSLSDFDVAQVAYSSSVNSGGGTAFFESSDRSFTGDIFSLQAVPEPSSLGLLALGLFGLASRRRRKA